MRVRITFLLWLILLKLNSQVNLDFESMPAGTYSVITGWNTNKAGFGNFNASGLCQTLTISQLPPSFKIISTPFTIPATAEYLEFNFPTVPSSPFFGTKVLELNSSNQVQNIIGSIIADQTFTVNATNQILQYAYFAAIKSIFHPCCETHYNLLQLLDCNGNVIPFTTLTLTPLPTASVCANTGTMGMVVSTNTANFAPHLNTLYTPNWLIRTYNLSSYMGTCVTLKAESGTCNAGGHNGLFYFDAKAYPSAFFVNNQAVAGSSLVICNTASATLSTIPAFSYSWAGPGSFTANTQSCVATTAGVYTVTLGNAGGIAPLTQTFNLILANTPSLQVTASSTMICAGQTAVLSANGAGITSYAWSNGSASPITTVTPFVNTIYTFTANTSICPAIATVAINVNNCTGFVKDFVNDGLLKIYPNPNSGNFKIKGNTTQNIKVYDLTGRVIENKELNESNKYEVMIADLVKGVYFIVGATGNYKVIVN